MSPLPDTFHNPYLWPLLLFALLPTLLYIIDRRKARRMDWPALRFFLTRQRARMRWIRLREALLIAVRSLALFLMVYALLGPVTRIEKELGGASPASRGLVLVFDTSFSMAYHPAEDSGDLLARGKRNARALLDELGPTDTALVLAPANASLETSDELFDLEKTRLAMEELQLAGGSFDLLRAIDEAIARASRLPSSVREIYIFTDLQGSGMGETQTRNLDFLASRLAALDPTPSIQLVDCGVAEAPNNRVVEFESDSLVTGTDAAIGLRARVATFKDARDLYLRITVNGEIIANKPLAVGKTGSPARELTFQHRFSSAGPARVSAEIVGEKAGDGLPADDARHLVIEVLDRLEVPILQASPDRGKAGGGHWLDLALFPRYGEAHPPEVIFRPVILGSANSPILDRSRVLILSGLRMAEARELELIEAFVHRGGGLLIFADAETDSLFANQRLWRGGRGLLPVELLERQVAVAGESYHPLETSMDHPVFSIFKGVSEADLARLSIRSLWQTGSMKEEAAVLSKTSGGPPWIIEHSPGKGRVVFFATGADPTDTDLPRTPLFVPLLHRMIRYLALGPSPDLGRDQGEPIEVALEADERSDTIRLTSPAEEAVNISIPDDATRRTATWKETRETGFYSFDFSRENGDRRTVTLAVNMNPDESNLKRIDKKSLALLERKLGLARGSHSRDRQGARREFIDEIEHWPYALFSGLLLLLCELVLLRGFASTTPGGRGGDAS